MRFVIFCHSLLSDWNHGNAHFLRGVATEMVERGHTVQVYEPHDAWSLVREHGPAPLEEFREAYPALKSTRYRPATLDLDEALGDADLVLVHEWNDPVLVRRIGEHRARSGNYRLFFHDTHHRSVTSPDEMAAYDLDHYDGVLAFGEVIRWIYERRGMRAWTWHEAADTRVFRPLPGGPAEGALVWIGNWGDDERTAELDEFLLRPARELELPTRVYGVRYPGTALAELGRSGIEYGGWLPNYRVPEVYARYRFTVHIPRRPYARLLPGIPTIRVFEALACGIPLISAPWNDVEGLFRPGRDYLVAPSGQVMQRYMTAVNRDSHLREELARNGLDAIRARHTCRHRVDELLAIYSTCGGRAARESASGGSPAAPRATPMKVAAP